MNLSEVVVRTRMVGPTDTKGTRIVASIGRQRFTFGYLYDLSLAQNMVFAAQRAMFEKTYGKFEDRFRAFLVEFDSREASETEWFHSVKEV